MAEADTEFWKIVWDAEEVHAEPHEGVETDPIFRFLTEVIVDSETYSCPEMIAANRRMLVENIAKRYRLDPNAAALIQVDYETEVRERLHGKT